MQVHQNATAQLATLKGQAFIRAARRLSYATDAYFVLWSVDGECHAAAFYQYREAEDFLVHHVPLADAADSRFIHFAE